MDNTAELWFLSEHGVDQLTPPVATRAQVLPFHDLTWDNFERLCYRLAWRAGEVVDCRRYGVQGDDQQGIDIYVRSRGSNRYDVWQCKKHQRLSAALIEAAVDEFLKGKWVQTSVSFHLAVSARMLPAKLADAVEKARKKCAKRKVEFAFLDQERLSGLLKPHPDLVDDFFDRGWVEAFCGSDAAAALGRRRLDRQKRISARKYLRAIYEAHFATVDTGLPAAAPALRNSVGSLLLHDRFVPPMVETVSSAIELRVDVVPPPVVAAETREATRADREDQQPQGGFRVREHRTSIGLLEWFAEVHSGVLIGGPGLGKSASLRYLTIDLLAPKPRHEILARKWEGRLPLFLPFAMLTRLVAEREAGSMPDFLTVWLKKLSVPADTITLMLEALEDERLLLILDGLDEWTDATAASTALTMVLDFARPRNLPILTSTRKSGVDRLGLPTSEWKRAELQPLGGKLQREFTRIWIQHFQATADGAVGKAVSSGAVADQTDQFMTELGQDSTLAALAGIPLLLSTLIYLRLQGRVLPRHRFAALDEFAKSLIAQQPQLRARASLQGSGLPPQYHRLTERGIEFLALLIHERVGSDAISTEVARQELAGFYQGAEFRKPAHEAIELAEKQIERITHEIGILVRREDDSIGYLHRTLQEFLAAKQLTRLPAGERNELFVSRCGEQGWHEVLLAYLYLIKPVDEIDALLESVRKKTSDALAEPRRLIFLARAVFGDVNCSADLARTIATELFDLVEASPWHALRSTVLTEVVNGIESEVLGEMVRAKLKLWFPGHHRFKFDLFEAVGANPLKHTGRNLLVALFNTHAERVTVAEAIANGASRWPELGEILSCLVTAPAEAELSAIALHALALGWPQHPRLAEFLRVGSASVAPEIRVISLIHRANRGDTSPQIRDGLAKFAYRAHRIHRWEHAVIKVLTRSWPKDKDFRIRALRAAGGHLGPEEWDSAFAYSFLVAAWPGDDQVAEIIANRMMPDTPAGVTPVMLAFDTDWPTIKNGFTGHPVVARAAENWLAREGKSPWENYIAKAAMFARSKRSKEILLRLLDEGKTLVGWLVHALVEIAGADDVEVRAAVARLLGDGRKVGQIARYLPLFIPDARECEARLLMILSEHKGFDCALAFEGLEAIGRRDTEAVRKIVAQRLSGADCEHFWFATKASLMKAFRSEPLVRQQALLELRRENSSLGQIVMAYPDDPEIRSHLEDMLLSLDDDLRYVLVQALRPFVRRGNSDARRLVALYTHEPGPEQRSAAAAAHYESVLRTDSNLDVHLNHLRQEMKTTGPGFDERTQAAAVGLIVLKKYALLGDPDFRHGREVRPIPFYSAGGPNWELVRIMVEHWEALTDVYGERVWTLCADWRKIVVELGHAGKRHVAAELPMNLRTEGLKGNDRDAFIAMSVVDQAKTSLRDQVVSLFRTLVNTGAPYVSWSHNTIEVILTAAHYLADHHAGDRQLATILEEIAQTSHDPTGPVVALCRAWPRANVLEGIWRSSGHGVRIRTGPLKAWLMNVKATPVELVQFIGSLPTELATERAWSFPSDIVRALQERLQRDSAARQALLTAIASEADPGVIASAARLFGTATSDRPALRAVVAKKLSERRATVDGPCCGFDIVTGDFRSLELALLESCLL